MYKIHIISMDFLIEENFGTVDAIVGGNLFILVKTQKFTLIAAEAAVNAIKGVNEVITPFNCGIIASGSKIGSKKYKFMNVTTNEKYCSIIKDVIKNFKLNKDTNGIYEIVFDGLTEENVVTATQLTINAIKVIPNVQKISAGNMVKI